MVYGEVTLTQLRKYCEKQVNCNGCAFRDYCHRASPDETWRFMERKVPKDLEEELNG